HRLGALLVHSGPMATASLCPQLAEADVTSLTRGLVSTDRPPGGTAHLDTALALLNYPVSADARRMAVNIGRLPDCLRAKARIRSQTRQSPPHGCSLPAFLQSHGDGLIA